MTFAVVTILLFNIRLFLLLSRPERPPTGIQKVLPYLSDTVLLFAGLWLTKTTHFTPFSNADRLGVKILLLLVYIGLGVVMTRARPRSSKFSITYLLAMACVGSIVYLAIYEPS